MSYREENVPRADNVPPGERKENEQRSEHRAESGVDSANQRGHDAHGRGVPGHETHVDDVDVAPGEAEAAREGALPGGRSRRAGQ